ncbi:MAG: nucleoid-structuring protein H-NS [Candidatus Raymondbacteria bacterium RifOxyA12_full_50_37]|uniref:Nucleoid-structuring protein H-NS n=1 Tax=Candidatus Raymondbacteria bacterium RIFOXYD12_FULL_49_13 TaxID=1817890 RepID=A0A1F7FK30_UNCRA|nr:MAG: nucleoid-structuring protein H-NS [Candidatus Raymondbacteria bacterium RifOxyA12_full_50_37]OGJ91728.1 MAG: nucleoid-structuring protein H-NS [Candidatus Raymondbacteria bacterium RIFOXYA2_FULL_49_16]OGK03925.1 MAG: nucleoid-structuring protein H-NS [Candidatus Raymondbacteria bacterium RifOxyB12_full_50_8]OGK06123.1 MAG: nucleoid-structuring protein H-NS [Candidatus Raymondbacteria bacterium RifOxyC12_full_50_8]OGK06978.1 MAG: nucleoid-structuring protein H-NS [Candidatus Raymondbacte
MYRPEITVVDCTIRDGGLMNKSNFSMELVRAVYKAICASGIQVVELGYRNSKKLFDPKEYGPWRFCDEAVLRDVVGEKKGDTKIAVMMDSHKADYNDLLPREKSVVDMVRVATYVKDIDKAIKIEQEARARGYQTTINIMAISHTIEWELDEALQQIDKETEVQACYIVDSFGALYSEDIDYYVQKYRKYLHNKEIGIHCHNSMQLAFANTIEGIIKNANWLDATLCGMGRASGNCATELLLGFLKNPKFDLRPVLDVVGAHIYPLREHISWGGEIIPFQIAGMLNMRPDEALKLMELPKNDPARNNYRAFYERSVAPGED